MSLPSIFSQAVYPMYFSSQSSATPVFTAIDPVSVASVYNWNTDVEFEINGARLRLGKLIDAQLEFGLTNTVIDASGTVMLPTPYWTESIVTSIGGTDKETTYKDQQYFECFQCITNQDFLPLYAACNMTAAGASAIASSFTTAATTDVITRYLPLWANMLITAQPVLRHINTPIRIRVHLSATEPATSGVKGYKVTSLRLLLTTLNTTDDAGVAQAHAGANVVYPTLIRARHVDAQTPAVGVNNFQLSEFVHSTAGLLTFLRYPDSTTDYTHEMARSAITSLNLRAENGQLLFKKDLAGQFITAWAMPWTVATITQSNYLLAFSGDFQDTIDSGVPHGAYQLTGREHIVATLPATPYAICEVDSWKYAALVVSPGGVLNVVDGVVSKKAQQFANPQ